MTNVTPELELTLPDGESDPYGLFSTWYAEAHAAEQGLADAMVIATVGSGGAPSARVVLLKSFDDRGFLFYTNNGSRKGDEINSNPLAALCFHWKSLGRQVRVEGAVQPVEADEADAYFASRPRGSQLGAWASRQSEVLPSRAELHRRLDDYETRFAGAEVTRPPFWSGYLVAPTAIEFWVHRDDRLHERLQFRRVADVPGWTAEYLYP